MPPGPDIGHEGAKEVEVCARIGVGEGLLEMLLGDQQNPLGELVGERDAAVGVHERTHNIDAITMGRQVRLAGGLHYEPLTTVRGLPVFPSAPLTDQLEPRPGISGLESHLSDDRADVATRVLRRGVDFDHVLLAVSLGMVELVAAELIEDRPEWRDMTMHIRTVATQAFRSGSDSTSPRWDGPILG